MSSVSLILVVTDDWQGVYVDGVLEHEGHRIEGSDWIRIIGRHKNFGEIESYWADEEYMHDVGNFPNKFEDLPKDILE